MKIKNVVVGAGMAGSVIARRIAEEQNEQVLIVEKRNHLGGNCYDYYDDAGILVHKYGPHIFHTNSREVWEWLGRFTDWRLYQHRVRAYVDGRTVPMPITVETVNELFGLSLSTLDIEAWFKQQAVPRGQAASEKLAERAIQNAEDFIVSQVGEAIYEKIFKQYTYKQWGKYPDQLKPDLMKRVPIRFTRDDRYFTDRYQGLPAHGYYRLFENILDHPNIKIMLNTNWQDVKDELEYDRLFFTGKIDEYFDYKLGRLEYRSLRFKYETYQIEGQGGPGGGGNSKGGSRGGRSGTNSGFFQEAAVINYPNDYDFTRITEYKQLTGQISLATTIAKEYPQSDGEPYYVVPDDRNDELAEQYRKLAGLPATGSKTADSTPGPVFIGRLAEYRYYNMDRIVERALEVDLGKSD
jgi:UDP-galactopyranose mutase